MSKLRVQRRERTAAMLQEPEFFPDLLEEIAEGRTLAEVVREHDIKFKAVYDWIMGDDQRTAAYEAAIQARNHRYRDRVLEHVRTVTDANLLDAIDGDGEILPPDQIPDSVKPAIVGYEVTTSQNGTVTRRIKMADKTRGAELLGRTQAMFTDKVDVGGKMTLEQLVMASMKPDEAASEA